MTTTKSRTAWLLAGLIVICIMSPVLTGYGAVGATLAGNRLELESTVINTAGYVFREISYLIIGVFGLYFWVLNAKSRVYLIIFIILITTIIIKDSISYGTIDWAPYGLRPLLIGLSCQVVIKLLDWGCQKQLNVVTIAVKLMVVVLIPVTIFQLVILPPSWGMTFIGPRTLGFWPNPINYSMALASIALYFFVLNKKHANLWLLACALLALTTGGRSGLLAIGLLILMQIGRRFNLSSLSHGSKPLVYLIAPLITIFVAIGLFNILSRSDISGREDTQGVVYNGSRAEYVVTSIAKMSRDGTIPIFFGNRLGDGTNALYSTGKSKDMSDNFFLMVIRSYGFFGLIFFSMLVATWLKRPSINKVAIIACGFSFMMAQSFLEQHPIAILTLIAVAVSIHEQRRVKIIHTNWQSFNNDKNRIS